MIVLCGIPAIVCAMTRHARSAWPPVLVLAVAILIAPWVTWFWIGSGRQSFHPVLGLPSWEPLVLGAIMLIPVLLMRRFVPAFRSHEDVPQQ